jgi:hypothetical protein
VFYTHWTNNKDHQKEQKEGAHLPGLFQLVGRVAAVPISTGFTDRVLGNLFANSEEKIKVLCIL